jgi:hypothetical protein
VSWSSWSICGLHNLTEDYLNNIYYCGQVFQPWDYDTL